METCNLECLAFRPTSHPQDHRYHVPKLSGWSGSRGVVPRGNVRPRGFLLAIAVCVKLYKPVQFDPPPSPFPNTKRKFRVYVRT